MSNNFTQELTLPSGGILNPEIPDGKLIQRCMMVSDQKFLAGSKQSSGNAIHRLLQNTITSPEDFDVSKLTLPDTLYLLFKLRILSYGNHYRFKTKCPECGKKITVSVDLSELPVESLSDTYEDDLVVKLPNTGDTVYTKILTNADMESLDKEIKRRKRKNPDDQTDYVVRIAYSISKIVLKDGKKELTHPIDIEKYILGLTDLDASAIIATRDSVTFGINPIIEYVCPECGEYIDISLQFSSEFFRPSINK